MVQWQIDRQVNVLIARNNDDPEFIADLQYLSNVLETKLEDIRWIVAAEPGGGTQCATATKMEDQNGYF